MNTDRLQWYKVTSKFSMKIKQRCGFISLFKQMTRTTTFRHRTPTVVCSHDYKSIALTWGSVPHSVTSCVYNPALTPQGPSGRPSRHPGRSLTGRDYNGGEKQPPKSPRTDWVGCSQQRKRCAAPWWTAWKVVRPVFCFLVRTEASLKLNCYAVLSCVLYISILVNIDLYCLWISLQDSKRGFYVS